jgi:hypothetical protein
MSASSLRFVPDVVALAEQAPSLGEIHLATSVCGNELIYYGIHALELAYAVLGSGAVSCLNVGQPGRNIVRVRYENGRDLMLLVGEREWMRAGYQLNLYGTQGWRTLTPDLTDLYWYLLDKFLDLVRTGTESVPIEEEVEVIAVLEAGKRSRLPPYASTEQARRAARETVSEVQNHCFPDCVLVTESAPPSKLRRLCP